MIFHFNNINVFYVVLGATGLDEYAVLRMSYFLFDKQLSIYNYTLRGLHNRNCLYIT